MIYAHTARKANDKNKTTYAIGRNDVDHGKQPVDGGYSIWKRKANYRQGAKDQMAWSWVKVAPAYSGKKTGLSFVDAVKIMNKKLKRKEFIEELPK